MRMVVVLPAPFGPSNARIAPSGTRRETCETAVNVPKRLVKSYVSINVIFAFRYLALSSLLQYSVLIGCRRQERIEPQAAFKGVVLIEGAAHIAVLRFGAQTKCI